MAQKESDVRIVDGVVVPADRRVKVRKQDRVHFKPQGGKVLIDFTPYIAQSPFAQAKFEVPPGVHEVIGEKKSYKYDVYKEVAGGKWELSDDPEVVIE